MSNKFSRSLGEELNPLKLLNRLRSIKFALLKQAHRRSQPWLVVTSTLIHLLKISTPLLKLTAKLLCLLVILLLSHSRKKNWLFTQKSFCSVLLIKVFLLLQAKAFSSPTGHHERRKQTEDWKFVFQRDQQNGRIAACQRNKARKCSASERKGLEEKHENWVGCAIRRALCASGFDNRLEVADRCEDSNLSGFFLNDWRGHMRLESPW